MPYHVLHGCHAHAGVGMPSQTNHDRTTITITPKWVWKLILVACSLYPLTQSCLAGNVTSTDDIEFWIGAGSNETVLAIDWDGQSSTDQALTWGYRWDDSDTAEDLLRDVLANDTRLYAKINSGTGSSLILYGLGYDTNDDGQFALTDNTSFDADGIAISGITDLETSVDPQDNYAEGWWLGYWHVATASQSPAAGGSWTTSPSGLGTLDLTDGMWLSLAFTSDTSGALAPSENLLAAESPFTSDADFNDDLRVDGSDFFLWQRGFGTSNALPSDGDANGDAMVDAADLQIWTSTYGQELSAATIAIPEPSPVMLLLIAIVLFFGISQLGWEKIRGRPQIGA